VIDLAMTQLLAQTGVKRATLLGYCLGGIFATVYAATHPTNVENLVTFDPGRLLQGRPGVPVCPHAACRWPGRPAGQCPGRVDPRPGLGVHGADDARTQPADLA
jgi:pimeloyl-ACP methyl ester carboxylesterase